MSTIRRGSKLDFLAVLTILCSIEWCRLCKQQIIYFRSL